MRRVRAALVVVLALVVTGAGVTPPAAAVTAPYWRSVDAGMSDPPQAYGRSVACPAATFCVQLGTGVLNGVRAVYIVQRNGESSTRIKVRLPADTGSYANLTEVACVSDTSCVAVGSYLDTASTSHALIETYADGVWRPTALTGAADSLRSVACSATQCLAVGALGSGSVLAVRDSSGAWHVDYSDPSDGGVSGAACPTKGSCIARDGAGLLYRAKAGWQRADLVAPAGTSPTAGSLQITRFACPDSRCVAVGKYQDQDGNPRLVAERWNGRVVTVRAIALPAEAADAEFVYVAATGCAPGPLADTRCAAGVEYDTPDESGLLGVSFGPRWQAVPIDSTFIDNPYVSDTACGADLHCAVVGGYYTEVSGANLILDLAPSGAWEALPQQWSQDYDAGLSAVSCTSGACLAGGRLTERADMRPTAYLYGP